MLTAVIAALVGTIVEIGERHSEAPGDPLHVPRRGPHRDTVAQLRKKGCRNGAPPIGQRPRNHRVGSADGSAGEQGIELPSENIVAYRHTTPPNLRLAKS